MTAAHPVYQQHFFLAFQFHIIYIRSIEKLKTSWIICRNAIAAFHLGALTIIWN